MTILDYRIFIDTQTRRKLVLFFVLNAILEIFKIYLLHIAVLLFCEINEQPRDDCFICLLILISKAATAGRLGNSGFAKI